MKLRDTLYILPVILLAACNDSMTSVVEEEEASLIEIDGSAFHSEIVPFAEVGEDGILTRANIEGNSFESRDLIRLRVIAPYVNSTEYGESTWGNSYDDWRLYTWGGAEAQWKQVTANDFQFDVDNDFSPTTAPSTIVMPQATPFVFTATTFTEEVHHVISTNGTAGGTVILSFSNIFKADQRRIENYKASDVLWAQQFMQTGSDDVRLSFSHKMAALKIDVSKLQLSGSEEVVLTLDNMPDIDQQEVTIGNYYAEKMKRKLAYGDYYRTKCEYEDNGRVLGIVVPDEQAKHLVQVAFTDTKIPQTGLYTAYELNDSTFLLIIPPYTVPADVHPTLWLRQGENRWSAELPLPTDRTFLSGNRYRVKMKIPTTPQDPDQGNDQGGADQQP